MGDPSTSHDRPTPLMRFVLAVVTTATALCTAGPVIVLLGAILAVGLFVGAALALAHTGALGPATFASAHGYGLGGLIVFFLAALGYRVARRDAKGLLGAVSRRPLITAAVALPILSLVVVRMEWDHAWVPEFTGALVIDDLYFFSFGAVGLMIVIAALATRGLYRWAAKGQYRAGLITGAQAIVLALLLAAASRAKPSPTPTANNPALAGWQNSVAIAAQAPSGIEIERQLLLGVVSVIEPGPRGQPDPAAAAPSPSPDDDIRACIEDLTVEVAQVKRNVGSRFRLSEGDAHDIVQDALLNVCTAHARKRYTRLGAVLQIAAERRALSWARRRTRWCEIDERWPSCFPAPDELTRFQQEDDVLDAALCKEDPATKQIIWLHVVHELNFSEVGAQLGFTGDEARYKYNNARRRIQKRVDDTCGP